LLESLFISDLRDLSNILPISVFSPENLGDLFMEI